MGDWTKDLENKYYSKPNLILILLQFDFIMVGLRNYINNFNYIIFNDKNMRIKILILQLGF